MSLIVASQNHQITLDEAAAFTSAYRATVPRDRNGKYTRPIAHGFGKDDMKALLEQEGAVGFRIYYGLDKDGKERPVIVAIDANNNDMENLMLLDVSIPCPDFCSIDNRLNSSI